LDSCYWVLSDKCRLWLFCWQNKNLDYFQENNEDKKVTQVRIEPTHSHSRGGDVAHRLTGAPNKTL